MMRRGNTAAFEVLVARYGTRLLAFCRHLLGSREDAEDVLQEVLAAAFNAMLADERPINVRPWLYRIARNRCLNHLRRIRAVGVDSMDIHFSDNGESAADKVHDREEFRLLVGDINQLPETQKTALVLREMDALSYEQIAEAMETTVSSVKSLLVRARVSLAEASEARLLSCEEVRFELGEIAEGLQRRPSPLVRRHLRDCKRCATFRVQLKETNKALAALLPIGPLVLLKKLALTHISHSAGSGAAAGSTAAVAGSAAAGSSLVAGSTAGGFVTAGLGAIATKAAAGLAAAALVTAGAVEVGHSTSHARSALSHASLIHAAVQVPPVPPIHEVQTWSSRRVEVRVKAPAPRPTVKKTQSSSKKTTLMADAPPKAATTTTSTTAKDKPAPSRGRTQTQTEATVLKPPADATSTTATVLIPTSTTTPPSLYATTTTTTLPATTTTAEPTITTAPTTTTGPTATTPGDTTTSGQTTTTPAAGSGDPGSGDGGGMPPGP